MKAYDYWNSHWRSAHKPRINYTRSRDKRAKQRGGEGGPGERVYILRLDADDAATIEPSCRVLMSTTRDIVRRFKLSISDPHDPRFHGATRVERDIHAAGSDCSPRMWQICLVRRGTRICRYIHLERTERTSKNRLVSSTDRRMFVKHR